VNFIPSKQLVRYLSENSESALKAAAQLTADCRSAQEGIRCIGLSGTVEEKLARLLLAWVANAHEHHKDERRFKVPYKHEEIAQMIGSTRETVTRILGTLRKKKVIEIKGATLLVKDSNRLKQLAGE
jgi:CRP/FNR family transcriptional regulator